MCVSGYLTITYRLPRHSLFFFSLSVFNDPNGGNSKKML